MAFLIEKTLARIEEELKKDSFLFEADEQDNEVDAEEPQSDEQAEAETSDDEPAIDEPAPQQEAEQKEQENQGQEVDDPNKFPDVQNGKYVSNLKWANTAKTMLQALMTPAVPASEIPYNIDNVDINNADKVIDYVVNALVLKTSTDADEITDQLSKAPI